MSAEARWKLLVMLTILQIEHRLAMLKRVAS
jgi:hypothetical protein